jgi:hypothetical protein
MEGVWWWGPMEGLHELEVVGSDGGCVVVGGDRAAHNGDVESESSVWASDDDMRVPGRYGM